MDLRLYNSASGTTEVFVAGINDTPASRLEAIAGKVVKYILTDKGSDLLNPTYGASLISTNYGNMAKITYDVNGIVQACSTFIKLEEAKLPVTTEKLATLTLVSVAVEGTQLAIRLSLYTTIKNYAFVDVKKWN